MRDKPVVFLVGTQCAPELEEKFNKWYDETHIPMLLKSKLLDEVTRYKLAPDTEGEYPTYLAIYEFKDRQAFETWQSSPEMAAAREERQQTWVEKDFEVKWRVVYEPLKTWHR